MLAPTSINRSPGLRKSRANRASSGSVRPAAATSPDKAGAQTDAPVIALDIVARTLGGGVFVRDTVIRLNAANPKGYVVLDWRRGEPAQ